MDRKKCAICKRTIPIFFFNNHFSHCKQYYIVNTTRQTNAQERVFVKLFNFLDDELGLNKKEIFTEQKREFLNNQQYICIKEMQENARIEHMNNIYLNNLKKEREAKNKEKQLKTKMEQDKERKKQEYLTKINQERILKERKMKKIKEDEANKNKLKMERLKQERELRLKELHEQELERQRIQKKLANDRKIKENLEREREERIRIRLEKERHRNIQIDLERKQMEKENKTIDNINTIAKKIEFKMGNANNFIKKGVSETDDTQKTENSNKETFIEKQQDKTTKPILQQPNNHLDTNITNNLKNYSLMNLRSGGLNFNNNGFLNKVIAKYTDLFRHYIKGKSVVIVGPANSILGTGKGELIDKFDIVIRLNKALPVPQNLKKDIGSRTDIVYNALNTTDFPGQNNLDTNFYKQNGVKFVVSPYPLSGVFYNDIINYITKYQFDIPFRTVIPSKFFGFKNQLQTRPYTGTCAIMDILQFDVKALYITGIDFYNTPYYSQYRRIKKTKLNSLRENSIHSAFPQMEYLLYKSLIDKRVILDKTLEKLLLNQYFKFSNNLGSVNGLSIIQTENTDFLNIINQLLSRQEQPNILLIGKDLISEGIHQHNYDLYFDFTGNKYNIDPNLLISCNSFDNRILGNILFKKENNRTIVLTHNVKRILKFLLNILDIKHCSQKLFYIIYLTIIFKKITITGFNFNRELSKKQKYKELLLIKFLEKYNFIKII